MEFSRLTVGDPTDSIGLELEVIAAVVIGGASLSGGEGTVVGSLVGAMLMAVIRTGCTFIGRAQLGAGDRHRRHHRRRRRAGPFSGTGGRPEGALALRPMRPAGRALAIAAAAGAVAAAPPARASPLPCHPAAPRSPGRNRRRPRVPAGARARRGARGARRRARRPERAMAGARHDERRRAARGEPRVRAPRVHRGGQDRDRRSTTTGARTASGSAPRAGSSASTSPRARRS